MAASLVFAPASAQLNNSAFYRNIVIKPQYAGDVRLTLDALGFSKNNEYFNRMADGYTMFGYQFNPRLSYNPTENIRVEGGVFLQNDFGRDGKFTAMPTFTIKYAEDNYQLIFGTLQGSLNHRYIETLYDFERVMNNRLENGIQYIYTGPKFWLDGWIDWQRMIYKGDPYQEEIAGGISAEWRAWQSADSSLTFAVPLQFTAQHHGGQIDATELPLLTVFNGATGFTLEKKFAKGSKVKSIYTRNYAVGFLDYSNEKIFPFENGNGLYLNAGINTKWQEVMLSYWHGHDYIALLGGQWYQAYSRSYNDTGYTEPARQVVILRLMHDIKLWEGLILTLRLEPHYDLNNPGFEFSNSFHLNFNTDIFLKKVPTPQTEGLPFDN